MVFDSLLLPFFQVPPEGGIVRISHCLVIATVVFRSLHVFALLKVVKQIIILLYVVIFMVCDDGKPVAELRNPERPDLLHGLNCNTTVVLLTGPRYQVIIQDLTVNPVTSLLLWLCLFVIESHRIFNRVGIKCPLGSHMVLFHEHEFLRYRIGQRIAVLQLL